MRYDLGATIEQMASWLTISPRAVSYRLRSARRRLRGRAWADVAGAAKRARIYGDSQISAPSRGGCMDIGEL